MLWSISYDFYDDDSDDDDDVDDDDVDDDAVNDDDVVDDDVDDVDDDDDDVISDDDDWSHPRRLFAERPKNPSRQAVHLVGEILYILCEENWANKFCLWSFGGYLCHFAASALRK